MIIEGLLRSRYSIDAKNRTGKTAIAELLTGNVSAVFLQAFLHLLVRLGYDLFELSSTDGSKLENPEDLQASLFMRLMMSCKLTNEMQCIILRKMKEWCG